MNEQILWKGKPKKGFQLVIEDLIIIPFLCVFVFLIYFFFRVSHPGVPFIGLGLIYAIYSRYVKNILDRRQTEYYITPSKVVIKVRDRNTEIYFNSIKKVSYNEHPFTFKYGSIIFGEEENIFGNPNEKFSFGRRHGLNLSRNKITIAFIKDYKKVYAIINEQKNKSHPIKR